MAPVVQASDLRHMYPDGTRLHFAGLDFTVEPGESVVLLGPNGSGKTTLMFHLVGLLKSQGGTPLPQAVDRIRRMGFRRIGLLAFDGARHQFGDLAGFWFNEMAKPERKALRNLVADFEAVAVHAPFANLPLFTYDPRLALLALERVREAVDAAAYLGAEVVTVHANPRADLPVQQFWEDMVATFRGLGEYARRKGVRVGVETGFPEDVSQFADLLEAVGHPAVGATLDAGHLLRYVAPEMRGTPQGVEALNCRILGMARQLGPLVIHCHFHDVRASDWKDHEAVGRGVIAFEPLLAVGYEGMLELELAEEDSAQALEQSQIRLEELICGLDSRRQEAA